MLRAFAAVLLVYMYVYLQQICSSSPKHLSKSKYTLLRLISQEQSSPFWPRFLCNIIYSGFFYSLFSLTSFLNILHILIITIKMPEETRYITLNGDVPNGGVPPGRTFVSVAGLPYGPNPNHYPFSPAPFSAAYGPPPPYYGPQHNGKFSHRACSLRMLSFD